MMPRGGGAHRTLEAVSAEAFAVRGRPPRPAPLSIIGQLTERMHEEGVVYCHWKTNHTLDAALRGQLDVDLLVHPADVPTLTRLLAEVGFKPMVAAPCFTYPAISEYFALDRQTGSLARLHVYYRLITGEGRLKGYHLPWEHIVLSTRHRDAARGIYVSNPDVEMILFAVREALKLRGAAWLRGAAGGPGFRGGSLAEFRWLAEQVTTARVGELGRELLGQGATRRLLDLLNRRPSMRQLLAFRRSVVAALHPHRRYGPVEAVVRRCLKDAYWILGVVSRRWLRKPIPATRSCATGGRMIAFVGPDGSGKSTLAREIGAWLSTHLDVLPVYFGSGDGTVSLLRLPLQMAARMFHKGAKGLPPDLRPTMNGHRGVGTAARGPLESIGWMLWALTLSHEKRAKLRRAWQAHERGLLVICDRFPQNQVMGYMDGPLLSHLRGSRSRFLRALAAWERAPYEWAEAHPPDLVIRLDVSPAIAVRRKPDMGLSESQKRDRASRSLRYPAQTRVVPVDADLSLDDLLLKVKGLVWDAL